MFVVLFATCHERFDTTPERVFRFPESDATSPARVNTTPERLERFPERAFKFPESVKTDHERENTTHESIFT